MFKIIKFIFWCLKRWFNIFISYLVIIKYLNSEIFNSIANNRKLSNKKLIRRSILNTKIILNRLNLVFKIIMEILFLEWRKYLNHFEKN